MVGDDWCMSQSSTTKNVDSKGRLTLGEAFANRTVLVESNGQGEIIVRLARVIPERESWLYENKPALASVRRGLEQAAAGQFVKKAVVLKAASRLAAALQDD